MAQDEDTPQEVNALNAGQKVLSPAPLLCRRLLLRGASTRLAVHGSRQPAGLLNPCLVALGCMLCCADTTIDTAAAVPAQRAMRGKRRSRAADSRQLLGPLGSCSSEA